MGQHFTSNTSLNWLFVDLVWSIWWDRPCHHNPIFKGNLCPHLWNNKNGIESTVSNKMTAKLVVRHKSEKWKLWMPQFLRTVKQIFYPQISVSRIDVGVLDHASGCIVYYKTRLQKYGSWSVSRNLNIKPLLPIPTIKTVILCTVIKYRDSTAIVTIEQENLMMLCVSCVSSYWPPSPAAGSRKLNPDIFGCIVPLVFNAYLKLGWKLSQPS